MTADQHRAIGRILGFPSCCVEAWIADLADPAAEPPAAARGGIHERMRTYHEVEALHAAVSALLGRPWGGFDNGSNGRRFTPGAGDMEKSWVPCVQCAKVRADWYPRGHGGPFSMDRLEAATRPPSVTNITQQGLDIDAGIGSIPGVGRQTPVSPQRGESTGKGAVVAAPSVPQLVERAT